MSAGAKDRQISVRFAKETDAWRERANERHRELLEMFNEAALEIAEEDLAERESLLGGFAGGRATRTNR
jgi:hypothetical protein